MTKGRVEGGDGDRPQGGPGRAAPAAMVASHHGKARDVLLHAFARPARSVYRNSRPGARGRLRGERIPRDAGGRRPQRDRSSQGGWEKLTGVAADRRAGAFHLTW